MTEPLSGKRVLVTRPDKQAATLCALIDQAGGEAINLPALEIIPIEPSRGLYQQIKSLGTANIVIFISQNAVDVLLHLCKGDLSSLYSPVILAVGQSTAEALKKCGLEEIISPPRVAHSEALLNLPQLHAKTVRRKRIVIIRGEGGREHLASTLRARGAHVEYLEVYRRIRPVYDQELLHDIYKRRRPDVIVVTSGEGLQNLHDMLISVWGEGLLMIPLVVIGRRVEESARRLGFKGDITIARKANDIGLMDAVKYSVGVSE